MRPDINLGTLMDAAADVSRFFGREMPGSVYKVGPVGGRSHVVH
jgi:hypothetical protein